MRLTTAQILAVARRKLLETSDAIFTDDDLLLYANLAKDDIVDSGLTPDRLKTLAIAFTAGVATAPSDFQTHYLSKDSAVPGEGNTFEWVSLEDFRAKKYDRMLCLLGADQLMVYPTATASLFTDYYQRMDDMSVDPVVDSYLDASLLELIVYGILHRAFEDLQDFELAKVYREKYAVEMGLKTQNLSYAQESPQEGGELLNPISIL